jgi:hypothetical protein
MQMEEPLDDLVVVPVDRLELIWRPGDPYRQDMEA